MLILAWAIVIVFLLAVMYGLFFTKKGNVILCVLLVFAAIIVVGVTVSFPVMWAVQTLINHY
jgi:hypothetical protein